MAVRARCIADIVARQAARPRADGLAEVHTRQYPKRAAECIGGSLFWVVAGLADARQNIRDIVAIRRDDGTSGTLILLDRTLRPVTPRLVRPFQGWRYLEPEATPGDLLTGETDDAALPGELRRRLAGLCLL